MRSDPVVPVEAVTLVPAIAPLSDFGVWVRSSGLEIILFVLGAVLLGRFIRWAGDRITSRIDSESARGDALVRSEASKHRHTLAQVFSRLSTVLIWAVTGALVLGRFGVPFTNLAVPVTVVGVALGVGAQQVVRDLIGGTFIIVERQYGFGDLASGGGSSSPAATAPTTTSTTRSPTTPQTPSTTRSTTPSTTATSSPGDDHLPNEPVSHAEDDHDYDHIDDEHQAAPDED